MELMIPKVAKYRQQKVYLGIYMCFNIFINVDVVQTVSNNGIYLPINEDPNPK